MAQVTNEVKIQARQLAEPQPLPSKYNQQASSTPTAQTVEVAETSTSTTNQSTPVTKTDTDNSSKRENFTRPQQDSVNKFNLEMVNEAPQNVSSRNRIEHISQINNIDTAQKPATTNKLMETPYMIVVVNQSLSSIQQTKETSTTNQQSQKTDESKQPTSKII